MSGRRHSYARHLRILTSLTLVSTLGAAQELAPVDTNTVTSAASTNAPAVAIETPAAQKPGKPAITESELRKRYLSVRGAESSGPSGPTKIRLKDPDARKDDLWSRSLELGLTINRGNSDSDLYLFRVETKRKDDDSEFLASAQAQYGESDGERNKDAAQGKVRYRKDYNERTYQAVDLRGFHDALADVDYQVTATWSYGVNVISDDDTFLSIEAGPGYVTERKQNDTSGYVAAHVAERGEVKASDAVIVWHAIDYFPSLDDASRYFVTAEAGVESVLARHLRFRAALQDRYDNAPAEDKEKNDLFTVLSLIVNF